MSKRAEPLSAKKVESAKPGTYTDGGGLLLVVAVSGAAKWIFRYQIAGQRRDMGLGAARGVGRIKLAEARRKVEDLRRLLASGVDPIAKREQDAELARRAEEAEAKASKAQIMSFEAVAALYMAAHDVGWKNTKHRSQWKNTLKAYAYTHFGALPVAEIETPHVEAALRPIWLDKPETASRVRGRIEAVLDYATVQGWRQGANPARWRGHLDKLFARRGKVKPVEHHPALSWQDLPAFMVNLRQRDAVAARAMEFAILTAARSGEVFGATWREFDLDSREWVVPARRMKAGREHRVGLSEPAVALLRKMQPLKVEGHQDAYVFPGRRKGRPLSIMAMTMLLRRMEMLDITVHGFRSTFRDWAGETTNHAREVVEAALAHGIKNKAEAAYARGDLFTKRRKLMEDWATFCASHPASVSAFEPLKVMGTP
jgi:integrase